MMESEKSTFEVIYEVVKQIPKGCVATYGQVAALAGSRRWSRVVGYLRPVQNFNAGKKEEYVLRKKFVLDESELEHEQKSAC